MARSPEEELAEFLNPLPSWLLKVLWHDYSNLSQPELLDYRFSIEQFPESVIRECKEWFGWEPPSRRWSEDELRPEFERLLKRCGPAYWQKYSKNAETARTMHADLLVPMPRRKRGRPSNDALAERIWELQKEGKTNQEIVDALAAEKVSLSREAVESYLKTRRRPNSN